MVFRPGAPHSCLEVMSLATFWRNAVADFNSTAAIAPSSRYLVRSMVEPVRCNDLHVVVEFGPGTGAMTREILRLMPPDSLLMAFEISDRFVSHLGDSIPDKRLQVIHAGAETAAAELSTRGIDHVDGVVSSLGISMMDESAAGAIYRPLLPHIGNTGVLTQFQYIHRTRMHDGRLEYFNAVHLLRQYFDSVESTCVLRNLPPAHVLTCRGARLSHRPQRGESGDEANRDARK